MTRRRVLAVGGGIPVGYATKLFVDLGDDVVVVEPPGGAPMRRWSASHTPPGAGDGPLFRYLAAGTRSVTGEAGDDAVMAMAADADVVLDGSRPGRGLDHDALRAANPALVVVSITPWGLTGPWRDRPASDLVIQAEAGSIDFRGRPGMEPIKAGGRPTEFISGAYAAVCALAAHRGVRAGGDGAVLDVSIASATTMTTTLFVEIFWSLIDGPEPTGTIRHFETPSIEPTADGWVGFNTNTTPQFTSFCEMIGRPELAHDPTWSHMAARAGNLEAWNEIVHPWTRQHTTDEIIELARARRIPVAPVTDGRRVLDVDQFIERGVFVRSHDGGHLQPRPPYRIDAQDPPPPGPVPRPGEHDGQGWLAPATTADLADGNTVAPGGPLAGLKVLDLTAWWAGPTSTWMLAALGADVVHVESPTKPDGMRLAGNLFRGQPHWWEKAQMYLAINGNKRDLGLDLSTDDGIDVLLRLAADADVLVENYTPRVLEGFGLTWERLRAINERLVMVRMPAFGLSGPWRDRPGFAQTMEQASGMAWLTGQSDDQPRIQRGPCDPNAGLHAAIAVLAALEQRDVTGRGAHVESTMVEASLNISAEQVLEWTRNGVVLEREGNRGPEGSPQGVYACPGDEQWLAVSAVDDVQWEALCAVMGRDDWLVDPGLATPSGRRARHDELDEGLATWAASTGLDDAVEALVAAGVPAGRVVDSRAVVTHPQHVARDFFEHVPHPALDSVPLPSLPLRWTGVERWFRRHPPCLGEHNDEVLTEAGFTPDEIAGLWADGTIGDEVPT